MDTKLKADIAESAVSTELLSRGFNVLKPVGDRLPYDIAVDANGKLIRIQVKHAWYNKKDKAYVVDVRRTKTNRRRMIRKKYNNNDFDFAVVFIGENRIFYVIPAMVFNGFSSSISFIEEPKRQRSPLSDKYRENWQLMTCGS